MPTILLIPAFFILLYFLLIRPQQQRVRRQQNLVSSLEVGDRIVTIGGIIGRIVQIDGERAEIEVGDGVTIEFIRAAINRKLDDDHQFAAADGEDEEYDEDEDGADDVDEHDHEHDEHDHHGHDHEHDGLEGDDHPGGGDAH